MALLNHAKKELSAKIVYYGPGLSGKTTNLEWIHRKWEPDKRGKLISLETKTDRTLFFDFLPVDMGVVQGLRTRFHLCTVPGQAPQRESRRLVLRGVDGVVFVADSHPQRMAANRESLFDLEANLGDAGLDLADLPMVIQYNKRDLDGATPIDELEGELNPVGRSMFEAVAITGPGVLESLTAISRQIIESLNRA